MACYCVNAFKNIPVPALLEEVPACENEGVGYFNDPSPVLDSNFSSYYCQSCAEILGWEENLEPPF